MTSNGELTFEGKIRSITYKKDEFAIISVDRMDKKESLTALGPLAQFQVGERVKLVGKMEQHTKFGLQFKVSCAYAIMPSTIDGIREYLENAKIKGLSKAVIAKILDKFGEKALKIIENDPEALLSIEGIGRKRIDQIVEALGKPGAQQEVMLFLHQLDIKPSITGKLWAKFGAETIDQIKQNPYQMIRDIEGYHFALADYIAKKLGKSMTEDCRYEGLVDMSLLEAQESGHCCLPRAAVISRVMQVSGDYATYMRIIDGMIKKELLTEVQIGNEALLYHPWYDTLERDSVFRLSKMLQQRYSRLTPDILAFEQKTKLQLALEQKEAVEFASVTGVMLLTGGPGTGKTTMIQALIDLYETHRLSIKLAAPTGRAARRLSEATGKEATTLHRLLDFAPNEQFFRRDEENPIEASVLIVDEFSMVDLKLFNALLRAIPKNCRLIMVGDANQLPSVGPGRVYRDLIDSNRLCTVVLKHIYRQSEESQIVLNAHRILNGEPVQSSQNVDAGDFFIAPVQNSAHAVETIKKLIQERIPSRFGIQAKDIQVLVPMYKGICGADALNEMLQNLINPGVKGVQSADRDEDRYGDDQINQSLVNGLMNIQGEDIATQDHRTIVKDGRIKFGDIRLGDKVMQLKNLYDFDVYNGDIGIVKGKLADKITIDFDGKLVLFNRENANSLGLAYACSIHKSQGSEYPAVILPLLEEYSVMLQRDLLYTAVTRAKRLFVLVAQPKAVQRAIESINFQFRYAGLLDRLIKKIEN